MPTLQETLDKVKRQAPLLAVERLLREKCEAANVKVPKRALTKAAKQILSGNTDDLHFGDIADDFTITIDEADAELLKKRLDEFYDVQIPAITDSIVEHAADELYCALLDSWPKEQEAQTKDVAEFRLRLEKRYGKSLGKLRMLPTMGREMVQDSYLRRERDEDGELLLFDDVMLRLHTRACQVMMEIISLLENGFADGGMARWRTLHEIATVATLIQKYGPDMAERYAFHQNVESKKGLTVYEKCYKELGFRPFSKRSSHSVKKAHDRTIKKYGPAFKAEYGWAASDLS